MCSSGSIDFRSKVIEYHGEGFFLDVKESHFFFSVLLELTSDGSVQSEAAAKNGGMTEWIGMDSHHREKQHKWREMNREDAVWLKRTTEYQRHD